MNEDNLNPFDPEFLLSERMDRALSDDEERILTEALANQPALRRIARDLERLDHVLSSWAARCPTIDAAAFERRVREAMDSKFAGGDIDAQLAQWAGRAPVPNADEFVAVVRAGLAAPREDMANGEDRSAHRVHWFRFAAPLAAAAAIALVFVLPALLRNGGTTDRVADPGSTVRTDSPSVAPVGDAGVRFTLDRSRGARFAFDRTVSASPPDEELSFIAIGDADRGGESYLEG